MNLSKMLTIEEAAATLKVSVRTLLRWEEKGYFVPHKKEPNIRLYDPAVVGYWEIMLGLDRKLKEHLKLLSELRENLNKHNLEQDYIPGKKLKLMTEEDLKSFSEAYEAMEQWNKDYKKILQSIMNFPRTMLKATIEEY